MRNAIVVMLNEVNISLFNVLRFFALLRMTMGRLRITGKSGSE